MNNEFSTKGSLDTFVALAKLARLKTRWANYTSRMWDTGDAIAARERAVAYIGECIAEGIYRHEPAVFCPEIQTHFRAVGLIIDEHIDPGQPTLNRRRLLIERVEKFTSFAPYQQGLCWTGTGETTAESLNAVDKSKELFRFLRAREGGVPRQLRPTIPFTSEQARELIDEVGYLYEGIRERLRTIDHLFQDRSRDEVAWMPEDIGRNIDLLSHQLEREKRDRTLIRIDGMAEARRADVTYDPFFDTQSEPSPASGTEGLSSRTSSPSSNEVFRDENVSPERSQRSNEDSRSLGAFDDYRSAWTAYVAGEGSHTKAATSRMEDGVDDEERLGFDPVTVSPRKSEGTSLHEPAAAMGSNAARDEINASEGDRRKLSERQRTRSPGLDD
ncbi:hypothetical protein AS026_05140 [Rhizobium altiplani]|uniref:Uncharacterized protein n=1 Tax=Rhizobium altiplani TaxID=1864509 RepID=A0A120FLG0_9HYPH|nr:MULTISPECIES: hypothetical protein [Rhizobium]KWV52132.1 hypothetical protein AS026_05140 [Rhizobium altiplani]